jgi:hypothetical protein
VKPTTLRVRRTAAACALMMLIASAAAVAPSGAQGADPVGVRLATDARRLDVLAGRRAVVRGALRPATPGRTVTLQVLRGGRWIIVDRDRTDSAGRFALGILASQPGSRRVRVRFGGDLLSAPSMRYVGRLNVYRRASVSWYGPGLFGSRLACGGTLSAGTLGVANRSLPCGSRVTLRYRGRRVRVPVIDRGPFVGGREYDLTAATARRLGFHATGTVWTTR